MKQPRSSLFGSSNIEKRKNILSGKVSAIVLEGYFDYKEGTTVLVCRATSQMVMAEITEVRRVPLRVLSEKEVRVSGFENTKALLIDLKKHYPNIGMSSAVTFIQWTNVRGKLVQKK